MEEVIDKVVKDKVVKDDVVNDEMVNDDATGPSRKKLRKTEKKTIIPDSLQSSMFRCEKTSCPDYNKVFRTEALKVAHTR